MYNDAYYSVGYADGLKKTVGSKADITYVYHVHSSSCYCPGIIKENVNEDDNSWSGHTVYIHDGYCPVCHRTLYSADGNGNYEWNGKQCSAIICGKSTSTIEKAIIIYK